MHDIYTHGLPHPLPEASTSWELGIGGSNRQSVPPYEPYTNKLETRGHGTFLLDLTGEFHHSTLTEDPGPPSSAGLARARKLHMTMIRRLGDRRSGFDVAIRQSGQAAYANHDPPEQLDP